MKTARMFGWVLAGLMVMGSMAIADDAWKDYRKHMKRYYNHKGEAMEEAAEGDWDEYYEEMGKADANYRAAQQSKPCQPVVVVQPLPRQNRPLVICRIGR